MTVVMTDLTAKALEILKEALPNASRFGAFFTSTAPSRIPALDAADRAARSLGIELHMVPVRSDDDFRGAFANNGFIVIASSLTLSRRAVLADLASSIVWRVCSEQRTTSLPGVL